MVCYVRTYVQKARLNLLGRCVPMITVGGAAQVEDQNTVSFEIQRSEMASSTDTPVLSVQ
jgi:hypothetical protein